MSKQPYLNWQLSTWNARKIYYSKLIKDNKRRGWRYITSDIKADGHYVYEAAALDCYGWSGSDECVTKFLWRTWSCGTHISEVLRRHYLALPCICWRPLRESSTPCPPIWYTSRLVHKSRLWHRNPVAFTCTCTHLQEVRASHRMHWSGNGGSCRVQSLCTEKYHRNIRRTVRIISHRRSVVLSSDTASNVLFTRDAGRYDH